MEQMNEVKKEIRSLLISQKGGCTMGELQRDYRNFNGRECPYRELGFRSFRDLIEEITDVARFSYENAREVVVAVTTEETAKIIRMIAKQRGKKTTSRRGSGPPRGRPSPPRPLPVPSMSSLSNNSSMPSSYSRPHKQPPSQARLAPVGVRLTSRQPALPRVSQSSPIPQSLQRKIADLVAKTPTGCSEDELLAAYSNHFGRTINFKQLGFESFLQVLEAMPRYVTLRCVPSRGTCVFPVNTETPHRTSNRAVAGTSVSQPAWKPKQENSNAMTVSTVSGNVGPRSPLSSHNGTNGGCGSQEQQGERWQAESKENVDMASTRVTGVGEDSEVELVRSNVCRLLENKYNGVWAARLTVMYKEKYGQDLPVKELGYDSAMQFFKVDNRFWRAEQPIVNGDCIIFPNDPYEEEEVVKEPVSSFRVLEIPSSSNSPFLYTYVCHAESPDNFYVQLHANQKAILELGCYLQKSCLSCSELNPKALQPGLACCAMFSEDNQWYRARVVRVIQVDVVEVFFVDYGNTEHVPVTALRKIDQAMFETPVQAIRCKLGKVEPTAGTWSSDAVKRFRKLTVDSVFAGIEWSWKDDILVLCLCDTRDQEKDVYIHLELVKEGFAKFQDAKAESVQGCPTQKATAKPEPEPTGRLQSMLVPSSRRLVKRVQLTDDHVLHIINHLGTAFVVGIEIVSWLWPNEPDSHLTTKLEEKRLTIRREVLSRRTHIELFAELEKDFKQLGTYITVFVLTGVPEIIATFGNPYTLLYRNLEKEIEAFDSDPYWTTGGNSFVEPAAQQTKFVHLSDQELCFAHQTLEYQRNSLLRNVVTLNQQDSVSVVDKLADVEQQIAELKQVGEDRLKKMNSKLQSVVTNMLGLTPATTPTVQEPRVPVVHASFGQGQLEHPVVTSPGVASQHGLAAAISNPGTTSHSVIPGRGMPVNQLTASQTRVPEYGPSGGAPLQALGNQWRGDQSGQDPFFIQPTGTTMDSPFTDPEIRSVGLPTLAAPPAYGFNWRGN